MAYIPTASNSPASAPVDRYNSGVGDRTINTQYQNTGATTIYVDVIIDIGAGTSGAHWHGALGPTTSLSVLKQNKLPPGTSGIYTKTVSLVVPPGWYYEVDAAVDGAGGTAPAVVAWWES